MRQLGQPVERPGTRLTHVNPDMVDFVQRQRCAFPPTELPQGEQRFVEDTKLERMQYREKRCGLWVDTTIAVGVGTATPSCCVRIGSAKSGGSHRFSKQSIGKVLRMDKGRPQWRLDQDWQ